MTPERLAAFAKLVAKFCQDAQPGERVLVEATAATTEAALAVAAALVDRGAEPVIGGTEAVGAFEAAEARSVRALWDGLTGYVGLRTVGDKKATPGAELSPTDAAHVRTMRMTKRKTTTVLPDTALAQRANMSLAELEDYYASLLFLDEPQPKARLEELRDFQAGIVDRLSGASGARIVGEGTDLRLSVAGRSWQNSYGRRNTPSGEMFTSPVEDSAEGTIHFDVPSFNFGEPVSGVTLVFRQGEVVEATAEVGEARLLEVLSTDAGARRLGELGIGGNRAMTRFLGATLFDEKVAGTVHLALGKSYPQTGGLNDSAIHWDLIKDLRAGGSLLIDGVPLLHDGQFVADPDKARPRR